MTLTGLSPAYNNPEYINKSIIRAPAFQLRRHVWRISADWRELSCWLQMHWPSLRGKNVSDVMLPKLRPCFTLGITHAAIHITHAVCTRAVKELSRNFTVFGKFPYQVVILVEITKNNAFSFRIKNLKRHCAKQTFGHG